MTTKTLLQKITDDAYNGDEMSLLCGVYTRRWVPPDNLIPDPDNNLTESQAHTKSAVWHRSVWEILKHVADCKAMYAIQAFGEPSEPFPDVGNTLESVLAYLAATHGHVTGCLASIGEDRLAERVPTECHGESAAHLFWVLAQHDVSHGAQIAVMRDNL